MDEFSVMLKAREFINTVGPKAVPVPIMLMLTISVLFYVRSLILGRTNLVGRSKTRASITFAPMAMTAMRAKDSQSVMNSHHRAGHSIRPQSVTVVELRWQITK